MNKFLIFLSALFFLTTSSLTSQNDNRKTLEILFNDWREFEKPSLLNGAPDYTSESFNNRIPEFRELRERLNEIDKSILDTQSKVDWTLIWAEMNDF